MFAKLENALNRLDVSQLKNCLNEGILHVAEIIDQNLSNRQLVQIALDLEGKNLLKDRVLRYTLLATLAPEKIFKLAKSLGISADSDYNKAIEQISVVPYSRNYQTTLVLETLNLDESYLPDPPPEKENSSVLIEPLDRFYELLDYQSDIRNTVLKEIRKTTLASCLIHIPTGAGKTKTAMHILHNYFVQDLSARGLIVWLAHTDQLLRQAIDTFTNVWQHLGTKPIEIFKFWDKFELPEQLPESGIIFGGFSKFISYKKRNEQQFNQLADETRLIIIDEAHKAPALETKKVVEALRTQRDGAPNRSLIGLTATPGRGTDQTDEAYKLKYMFNNLKISADLALMDKYEHKDVKFSSVIELLQSRSILAKFEREALKIESDTLGLTSRDLEKIKKGLAESNDYEVSSDILKKIGLSRNRNQIIINKLMELNQKGHYTILFACDVLHAKVLSGILKTKKIQSALILGDTPSATRKHLIDRFANPEDNLKILINYGVLTTGFDCPKIDCVFITRPVGSVILYSQMIGRGIRGIKMGGNSICKLIEIEDKLELGNEKWAYHYFDNYWR